MKEKKKKLNKMSNEELTLKKEALEKITDHIRVTKAKQKPQTINWKSNQVDSMYYKHLIIEMKNRGLLIK